MNQFPFNKLSLIKQLNCDRSATHMSRAQSKSKKISDVNENFKKHANFSHPEKFYSVSRETSLKKNLNKIKIQKRKKSKQKNYNQSNSNNKSKDNSNSKNNNMNKNNNCEKKLSSKSFQQQYQEQEFEKVKCIKISLPEKNQTKIYMTQQLQNYTGQYETLMNRTYNKYCLNHHKKLSEFFVQIDAKTQVALCSYCTVYLAEKNYEVKEIMTIQQSKEIKLDDFLEDVDKQITNYQKMQQKNEKLLMQIEKYDNHDENINEDNNENDSSIYENLNSLLKKMQDCINKINKSYFQNYIIAFKKEKVIQKEFQKQIMIIQQELKKMKEDICENYDNILEKIQEEEFEKILEYYNEKMRQIKNTKDIYDMRCSVQPISQQLQMTFVSNFKQFYKSMLYSINPHIQITEDLSHENQSQQQIFQQQQQDKYLNDIIVDEVQHNLIQKDVKKNQNKEINENFKLDINTEARQWKDSQKTESTKSGLQFMQIGSLTNIYTQQPDISVDLESIRDELKDYSEQLKL